MCYLRPYFVIGALGSVEGCADSGIVVWLGATGSVGECADSGIVA